MSVENRDNKWLSIVLLFLVMVVDCANAAVRTTTWQRWEHTLISSREYQNPFIDVTVSVVYSGPYGATFKSLAFWDGKSKGTKHTISLAQQAGVRVIVNPGHPPIPF